MLYPLQHRQTAQLVGLPHTGTAGSQPACHASISYKNMQAVSLYRWSRHRGLVKPGNCQASGFTSVYLYHGSTPFKCTHEAYVDFDLTASYRLRGNVEIFANVLNVFDTEPEFDPASAYNLYGFNQAWELNGWRGRYFRVGARLSFE